MRYNVHYEKVDGKTYEYCLADMDLKLAAKMAAKFQDLYGPLPDGSPRPYPNGKGFYEFSNIRIVRKS